MAFGGGRHSGQFYALQRAILATQPGEAGQKVFAPVAHRLLAMWLRRMTARNQGFYMGLYLARQLFR